MVIHYLGYYHLYSEIKSFCPCDIVSEKFIPGELTELLKGAS
jgi:hypothetical protein